MLSLCRRSKRNCPACPSESLIPRPGSRRNSRSQRHRGTGTVTRSVEPDLGGDAIGDIYLTMMETCPSATGCVEKIVSDVTIPDADLSGEGAEVAFEMSKRVPKGTYYLSGIMDDTPNEEIPDIYAGEGDLVVFGQAAPACVEVVVEGTVGSRVGVAVEGTVGSRLGVAVTAKVGSKVGVAVGGDVGADVGLVVTVAEGPKVGVPVGVMLAGHVGEKVGKAVGG